MASISGSLALLTTAIADEGGDFNPFEFAPGATFWTWVIFLGSLPLMWKFVFGPITRALADRDQAVVDAARAADDARLKAEEAVAQAREEREQARAEARKMVAEATARAERQAQEAQKTAQAEADRMLQKAREDIDGEKRRALVEIRREVVELTIASTGRLLQKEVDDDAHRELVNRFLGELGGNRGTGGSN